MPLGAMIADGPVLEARTSQRWCSRARALAICRCWEGIAVPSNHESLVIVTSSCCGGAANSWGKRLS